MKSSDAKHINVAYDKLTQDHLAPHFFNRGSVYLQQRIYRITGSCSLHSCQTHSQTHNNTHAFYEYTITMDPAFSLKDPSSSHPCQPPHVTFTNTSSSLLPSSCNSHCRRRGPSPYPKHEKTFPMKHLSQISNVCAQLFHSYMTKIKMKVRGSERDVI
jgi:hypothetical protein